MRFISTFCATLMAVACEGRMHPKSFKGLSMGKKLFQPTDEYLSVLDYGAQGNCSFAFVDGEGIDNTKAFQDAINAAEAKHGMKVYVPPGCYMFSGELTLLPGVELQGSYGYAPSHDMRQKSPYQQPTDGTVLLPTAGRGNSSQPAFITMQLDSVLRGVVIYYPQQEKVNTPVPYPFSVFMAQANTMVQDVELLNSFNGISAVEAHRHTISRVQGAPINIGINVDSTYDIGRLEDVHFNPWFSTAHPFINYQLTFGRAFVLGRSDWEYVFNTFAFGYAVGYHFVETPTGTMNGNFLGLGADLAINASILVDASQPAGLLITNGEFTAFSNSQWINTTQSSTQVVVGPHNKGPVTLVNSAFWGPCSQIALLQGTSTTTFTGCQFVQWDEKERDGRAAINVESGAVVVQGSTFHQNKTQLKLGGKVKGVFSSNIITGKERVVKDPTANFQSGLNVADEL
eukprot:TRINITY_DN14865_c0_g1_i1.p1 TRINITY_DN14865_c0_g1~~TRINITY_DN14865_c0_g1_i1.p1  ORF type:complete len:457 (+),score=84.38 TRINITY_DN14865_c0_g1_i1:92-1462(+)